MAPKKAKMILSDVLENLEQKNYKKFCSALVDRDKRVKRNQVENKDFMDIANVMVNVYDKDTLKVAEELLREICCVEDANDLAEEAKKAGLHTSVPTVDAGPSPVTSDGKHFVDKHRRELINRVGNIGPILDELLDQEVLDNEAYNKINALPTNQEKVRELCTKYLNARMTKDIFYIILKKKEKFLIEELEGN
ncbi:apoptosis-associated speck-like protein containing a CARD isoform X1 [Poecilia latipinna]|uniref:apoptosis-associated speck-like protein containing a CARD isoform X1 n=1 Tax=Poecilia latipinna TaxID=48699 RepID=UPI00072DFB78|nr:PREDICTED: apoptosis-associated speck-like protein containing a CARD isoform X1 [Poecilia latipinna]